MMLVLVLADIICAQILSGLHERRFGSVQLQISNHLENLFLAVSYNLLNDGLDLAVECLLWVLFFTALYLILMFRITWLHNLSGNLELEGWTEAGRWLLRVKQVLQPLVVCAVLSGWLKVRQIYGFDLGALILIILRFLMILIR
jgi:hypothetical protein